MDYRKQFTLGELINQEKIDARLADGVLRLSLPKVEKAAPKKIAVAAGWEDEGVGKLNREVRGSGSLQGPEKWSVGVLEYWIFCHPIASTLQYSTTPRFPKSGSSDVDNDVGVF